MQPQQQRPCKFGEKCRQFALNQCTFYHPPNQKPLQMMGAGEGTMGNMGGQNNGGFGSNGSFGGNGANRTWQNRPNSFTHHQNNNQNGNFQNNFQTGNYPNNSRGGFQANNQSPNYQNFGSTSNYKNLADKDDNVSISFCRQFQLGHECKWGEKCKRKHAFLLNSEDSIKRLSFMRHIPNSPLCKLTKFQSGGQDYFALRLANDVNFFSFNPQTKAMNDIYKWSFPTQGNYHFYDQKNDTIYYSMQNPQTSYEDIGVYNLTELKHYYIANSHNGRVTGIAHFNETIMLSTSIDGELKVWMKEGDNYIVHVDSTDRLRKLFNSQNLKIELEFIDITEINGIKLIAVGTSDCRLLFFIGNDLSYVPITFAEPYSKVYRVRYATDKGVTYALALTWNANNSLCALLSVNLTTFEQKILLQLSTQDNSRANINIFELVEDYLLVGTIGGELSIYRFPDTSQKIGAICHQNQICDIVWTVGEIKSTNLKMRFMFILQKMGDKREGSLGIYLLK